MEAGAYTLLLIRDIEGIGQHYCSVKISRIGKMEHIELALILDLIIIGGTVGNKNEYVNTVCLRSLVQTLNYPFNIFIAEAVSKYSYPLIHVSNLLMRHTFSFNILLHIGQNV